MYINSTIQIKTDNELKVHAQANIKFNLSKSCFGQRLKGRQIKESLKIYIYTYIKTFSVKICLSNSLHDAIIKTY